MFAIFYEITLSFIVTNYLQVLHSHKLNDKYLGLLLLIFIRALNSITNSTKSGTESSMGERSEEDQKKMNKDNLL